MSRYLAVAIFMVAPALSWGQTPFVCPDLMDCSQYEGGCVVNKYGLAAPDHYTQLEYDGLGDLKVRRGDAIDLPGNESFSGSFTYGRDDGRPGCGPGEAQVNCECGEEDGYLQIFGTFIIREVAACDPFDDQSVGWVDPDGAGPIPGGCPVELAQDIRQGPPTCRFPDEPDPGLQLAGARLRIPCTDGSECVGISVDGQPLPDGVCEPRDPAHFFTNTPQVLAGYPPLSLFDIGGGNLIPIFTQLHGVVASVGGQCGQGVRVPNPDPQAAVGSTRIDWQDQGTASGGNSFICCNSPNDPLDLCSVLSDTGVDRYPALDDLAAFGNRYTDFPDWVFEGGRESNWEVDPDYVVQAEALNPDVNASQRYGVCEQDRKQPCDCGTNSACLGAQIVTATNPCPNLVAQGGGADFCDIDSFVCDTNRDVSCDCSDADLGTPGKQLSGPDSCYNPQQDVCQSVCQIDPLVGGEGIACTTDADCEGIGDGSCSDANNPDCANPCPGQGDVCDLRDFGMRLAPDSRIDPRGDDENQGNDGLPNPNACQGAAYRFRGTWNSQCAVAVPYAVNGDPGPDCSVLNFEYGYRPDLDCNGIDDTIESGQGDLCPFYTETNPFLDTNGNGRGDQCECGDSNRDGVININDILEANSLIFNDPGAGSANLGFAIWPFIPPAFGPPGFRQQRFCENDPGAMFGGVRECTDFGDAICGVQDLDPGPGEFLFDFGACGSAQPGYMRLWKPLADATNSPPAPNQIVVDPDTQEESEVNFAWNTGGDVNINDILAMNRAIFGVTSQGLPSCARYPQCGDGRVDPGNSEECDDGNTNSGDGCSNACLLE